MLQLMTIQTMLTMSLYSSISKRLPFAHVREMHCNRGEGFEIDFGVSACELKGTATVEAMTTAVMMNVSSDIPLDLVPKVPL